FLRIDPAGPPGLIGPRLFAEVAVALELRGIGGGEALDRGLRVVIAPERPGTWRLEALSGGPVPVEGDGGESMGPAACGDVLEMAVPWRALGALPGQPLQLVVRLLRKGQPVGRYPRDSAILLN